MEQPCVASTSLSQISVNAKTNSLRQKEFNYSWPKSDKDSPQRKD